jgi:hypothetical protein
MNRSEACSAASSANTAFMCSHGSHHVAQKLTTHEPSARLASASAEDPGTETGAILGYLYIWQVFFLFFLATSAVNYSFSGYKVSFLFRGKCVALQMAR